MKAAQTISRGTMLYNNLAVQKEIARLEQEIDKQRERDIDEIIPHAMAVAQSRVLLLPVGRRIVSRKGVGGSRYKHSMETEYFHEEMDKIKRLRGMIA